MSDMIPFIIIAALITAAILIAGVVTMARGQDITGKKSNKLMQARVIAQLATVVLILIAVFALAGD